MIVDCQTFFTHGPTPSGRPAETLVTADSTTHCGDADASLTVVLADYLSGCEPADKCLVLPVKYGHSGISPPNSLVAEFVRQNPERLIGFAGLDPSSPDTAITEMHHARDELGLRGVTISPAAQAIHPSDSRLMRVLAEAARLRMPVSIQQGIHLSVASRMEFARPHLLDEVARELPMLKMVVSQLGYPWIDECLVLLAKHPNVFADISGLLQRPWEAYNALLRAHEQGVMDKLLFGSDYPRTSAKACIEALYSINRIVLGTPLPTVPRQQLAGIVERDALALLGLPPAAPAKAPARRMIDEHDD